VNRLLTIRVSHYNEKARWALDRLAVEYREQFYMPFVHMLPVAWAVRGKSDAAADHMSTRYSTPVLVTDGGRRICDSSRIVRWASDNHASPGADLYPTPAAEALEARFSRGLGEHTRRVAYYWAIGDSRRIRALARANVGRGQAALFSALLPIGRSFLKRVLSIDAAHAALSRRFVLEEVAFASEELGGRRYLTANRFTAADLALSCMLAPVLLVSQAEGYGAVLPSMDLAHPDARAFAREVRETPAGKHAMRMFREERAHSFGTRAAHRGGAADEPQRTSTE
jgi:glutathione S-transferase